MPRKKNVNGEMVDSIIQTSIGVLSLIKRKMLRIDAIQSEHGIPLSHVQVLFMLAECNSMSISDISKRLSIAKPNITPLVDRLIEQGYAERRRDENDHRVVNVLITQSGVEKARSVQETASRQALSWISMLTEKEVNDLSASLKTIWRLLSDVPM